MNKKQKLEKKQRKEIAKRKNQKNYVPKTFYGFGRNFKRCENCQWKKDGKGAISSKNFVFCSYMNKFVHKKAELLCFNVQKIGCIGRDIPVKILFEKAFGEGFIGII